MFVLRPAHTNIFAKERSYKRSPVGSGGFSNLKMIFALLTEMIAIYMQLTIIHLRYLSLKKLLELR